MSWRETFTSYEGRINRVQFLSRHFVICFAAALGVMALVLPLSFLVELWVAMMIGFAVVMPPLMYADLSLVVRRFHDVNLSGWWILAALLPWSIFVLLLLAGVHVPAVSVAILMPVNLAYVALLLGVPGSKGDNRYGPPSAPGLGHRA